MDTVVTDHRRAGPPAPMHQAVLRRSIQRPTRASRSGTRQPPTRRPVADGQSHRVVAEVGNQVKVSAECFDVAGGDVDRGHFAVFDL
ncbi:hypothetical protein GCM10009780_61110 [Actinomadura alba]